MNATEAAHRIRNDLIFASAVGVCMVLLVLVAVIAPQDVITRNRFLHNYVALSSSVIPGIQRLAAVSSFPQVTRLVVSLMWTFVPIFTAVYLLTLRMPESAWANFRQKPFFLTFGMVVMGISVVLFAVLADFTPEDLKGGLLNETVLNALSTSRMGLGLIAGFFSAGIAAMIYAVLIWLLNLPRIYFRSERHQRQIEERQT
jgi:hypothetical protein